MTVTITEPGIYPDLDEQLYHADPVPESSLSCSGAKLLLDCPARFIQAREHPKTSRAFDEGTAAHAKVLGVGQTIVAIPERLLSSDGGIRSNEAKAWRDEQVAAGAVVLKPDVVARIDAMAEKLLEHPTARALLRAGEPERSLFARDPDTQVMLRARLDWTTRLRSGRPVIVDYKTSTTANPARFGKIANDLNYVMQDDHYRQVSDLLADDERHAFLFIVQEKEPPYLVSVCELDDDARTLGAQRNRRARQTYLECMTSGVWPGYPPIVHPVAVPGYALREITHDTGEDTP